MGARLRWQAVGGETGLKRGAVFTAFCLVCVLFLSSCSSFPFFSSSKKSKRAAKWNIGPPEPPKSELPYRDVNLSCPLSAIQAPKIYVYKNERRLLLIDGQTLVRDYRVGLGPHPNGDKFMQGDGRTPEGEYFICTKNSASKFYKSLGLSYPSQKHAEHAYGSGYISREEYENIVGALGNKTLPPFNTVLGGAIFIHGGGGQRDWTEGCVAVYNGAMDELFQAVSIGTPVQICP